MHFEPILRACCAVKYWKHNSIFRSCKKKSKSEDEAKANCHEPVYEMEKDENFEESLRVIGQSLSISVQDFKFMLVTNFGCCQHRVGDGVSISVNALC